MLEYIDNLAEKKLAYFEFIEPICSKIFKFVQFFFYFFFLIPLLTIFHFC